MPKAIDDHAGEQGVLGVGNPGGQFLAALAFGEKITASDIFMEGIRRITPLDFQYAEHLKHTIRLVCGARTTPDGLVLFVRPAELVPELVGLDEWGYPIVSDHPVSKELRKHAKKAVNLCPKLALTLAKV